MSAECVWGLRNEARSSHGAVKTADITSSETPSAAAHRTDALSRTTPEALVMAGTRLLSAVCEGVLFFFLLAGFTNYGQSTGGRLNTQRIPSVAADEEHV